MKDRILFKFHAVSFQFIRVHVTFGLTCRTLRLLWLHANSFGLENGHENALKKRDIF